MSSLSIAILYCEIPPTNYQLHFDVQSHKELSIVKTETKTQQESCCTRVLFTKRCSVRHLYMYR